MARSNPLVALLIMLAGCGAQDPDKPPANPTVQEAPAAAAVSAAAAAPADATPTAPPSKAGPDLGPLYTCVSDSATGQRRGAIELSSSVEALCRKAPEMGPCQYAREACRRSGGRVYAADGTEITRQIEAEYDRRVLRIRMKSN